jgi:acyl carrier protein
VDDKLTLTDTMNTEEQLKPLLDEVLHLGGRSAGWSADTPLLGSVPELDSMAVVGLISALEQTFAFMIDDDDISADMLATLGSLAAFVDAKRAEGR